MLFLLLLVLLVFLFLLLFLCLLIVCSCWLLQMYRKQIVIIKLISHSTTIIIFFFFYAVGTETVNKPKSSSAICCYNMYLLSCATIQKQTKNVHNFLVIVFCHLFCIWYFINCCSLGNSVMESCIAFVSYLQ